MLGSLLLTAGAARGGWGTPSLLPTKGEGGSGGGTVPAGWSKAAATRQVLCGIVPGPHPNVGWGRGAWGGHPGGRRWLCGTRAGTPKAGRCWGAAPSPGAPAACRLGHSTPKPPPVCAIRAVGAGQGDGVQAPRGGGGGLTVVWGPGILGLLRHLHPCCAKLSSRPELEPAPVCWREEIQERGAEPRTSSTQFPPVPPPPPPGRDQRTPGTNQGTEGEARRGGWCGGSSELSPRWRGWGKAQRPPQTPRGAPSAVQRDKKRGSLASPPPLTCSPVLTLHTRCFQKHGPSLSLQALSPGTRTRW